MPLPLGHSAIGFTAYSFSSSRLSMESRIKIFLFVVLLANLPDIDVVFGLLMKGNGNIYHRGPTHSLLFSLVMGYLFSRAHRIHSFFPKMSFTFSFLLIFSHVIADLAFTNGPVSLFYPLETNWSSGSSSIGDILDTVIFQCLQDIGILVGCGSVLLIKKFFTSFSLFTRFPFLLGRRAG